MSNNTVVHTWGYGEHKIVLFDDGCFAAQYSNMDESEATKLYKTKEEVQIAIDKRDEALARTAKVKLDYPIIAIKARRDGSPHELVGTGTITGIHAGNGNLLVKSSDPKQKISGDKYSYKGSTLIYECKPARDALEAYNRTAAELEERQAALALFEIESPYSGYGRRDNYDYDTLVVKLKERVKAIQLLITPDTSAC